MLLQSVGMFDQLETMVQNLGNNYVATRNNIKKIDYNPNDSDSNFKIMDDSRDGRNQQLYNTAYTKCKYLEALNSNLVEENKKLKQTPFQPKEQLKDVKLAGKGIYCFINGDGYRATAIYNDGKIS